MSESPKEKPQTLSGYVSLVKKIENIINQITENEELTQTEEEDSLEQQDSEIVIDKESAAEAVTKVEKQTLQLEESITQVVDEEKKEVQAERLPDLVKIEKELGELYPGAEVQVTDFYYAKDELTDDEIKKRIMSKIPSLEAINIRSKESYGFPFVLCKLEGHYEAIIPINLENISLPTIQHGVNRQFKLLFAGTQEVLELTPSENEIWNQSFNRFQIKLTQLLNTKVKSNLSKKPYKMKLINLDTILIKDFINEYHKKLKNLQNYQDDVLLHLKELIGIVEKREGIWKNTDDFSKTKKLLKLQMIDFEKKKKNLSKETQVEFFKLKKTQRRLDARTKKFKLDEKRNKTITREEKEALIKDVRKFQKKKAEIQKEIDHAKKIDKMLKEWIEILNSLGLEQANAKFLEAFSEDFSKNILELLEHENLDEFLEKATIESADFSNITLHVLYIPTLIYSFKAKQGSQKIEGKILYLAPAQETIFLKPPVA